MRGSTRFSLLSNAGKVRTSVL